MIDGRFALAFTTGLLAAVNPCGFAMLPAYLSFFLGREAEERDRSTVGTIARALVVSASLIVGFLVVFVVLGTVIKAGGDSVYRWASYLTIVIGALLAVLGLATVLGHRPRFATPRLDRGGTNRSVPSMTLFGVSYAIASLGCALPLFISNVLTSFDSRGLPSGVLTFVMFSLGMGLLVTALTLTLALSQGGLLHAIRRLLPYVERSSAAILIGAGIYFVYYGLYEVRGTGGSGLAQRVSDWQGRLATWINDTGPTTVGLVLGAIVAIALGFVLRRRQASR